MAQGPNELRECARAYYTAVDSGDVHAVLACFAADAVYRRPGYEPIVGTEGLRAFYTGVRVIESGRHTLDDVLVEGERAAIRGRFDGRLRGGADAHVGFADFFGFDEAGRIATRTSYFFAASV